MTWDAAIQEAYASVTESILSTLSLDHPSFDEPAYIVCDHADLAAQLETGVDVLFQKCAFSFSHPESSGKLPTMQIAIDNVSQELSSVISDAMGVRAPIDVVYREFLEADALNGPGYVLTGMSLKKVNVTLMRVTGTATFFDYINRGFPTKKFTVDFAPGLSRI